MNIVFVSATKVWLLLGEGAMVDCEKCLKQLEKSQIRKITKNIILLFL